MAHCADIQADRALGQYWERRFCELAAAQGFVFTPMQIGRNTSVQAFHKRTGRWNSYTLPDITVWTAPGQHHEIKHKNPTHAGRFGLEAYRLQALLAFAQETSQDVMYTIHNHEHSGGRLGKMNRLADWFTANILALDGTWANSAEVPSYVDGKAKAGVMQYYWRQELWTPLAAYWAAQRMF